MTMDSLLELAPGVVFVPLSRHPSGMVRGEIYVNGHRVAEGYMRERKPAGTNDSQN